MSITRPLIAAVAIVLLLGARIVPAEPEPQPTTATLQHPCLFMDAEAIARVRQRAARQPWAGRILSSLVANANAAIATPLAVPSIPGQWSQHYACKSCGCKLDYQDGRHLCPQCHKEYVGWPYDEVIAARTHIENWKNVKTLGLAYALTSDTKYASRARDILVAYADAYTSFPIHDYRGGGAVTGGRVLAQTLDESVHLIGVAWGYDLIYNAECLSPRDRRRIEDRFLRQAARTIRRNDRGVSNWQSWHNAAMACIGRVIGDDTLFQRALTGRSGLDFQLEFSVLPDGFWYEGTPGYHFYALEAILYTALAARQAGIDYFTDPVFKSLFDAPLDFTFPDGTFPAINDSDILSIGRQDDLYEIAFGVMGDPRYATVASVGGRKGSNALLLGADSLPKSPPQPAATRDFPGIGGAMIRAGSTTTPLCVYLKYGPHGGAHGHPDKLGLIVHAGGREIIPDPGRLAYSVPLHREWYKTTLAHNTIIVDQQSQQPAKGSLSFLAEKGGVTAARAECDTAVKGVQLARTVIVKPGYLLDIATADSPTSHTYDLAWHVDGVPATNLPLSKSDPLSTCAGYQHLKNLRTATATDPWIVNYATGKSTIRQTHILPTSSQVYLAEGLTGNPPRPCPASLTRQQGTAAEFVTLTEFDANPTESRQIVVSHQTSDSHPVTEITVSEGALREIYELSNVAGKPRLRLTRHDASQSPVSFDWP
ncbi:MAG: heparinase II/III family protein [Candidatus Sumerlaeaceae bacterium]|nr:heparinase II/III family protein [Candidatus Sumerlaeaceae bacterium]